MRHVSSKPRSVTVSFKSGETFEFPSVSSAARAIGIGRTHAHANLAGRTGKRANYKLEYCK